MISAPDILNSLGEFHPLVLHFPIGLIAGVVCLEFWTFLSPSTELRRANSILLTLACAGAVAAAGLGLLLAESGGYDADLLFRHRISGLATAVLSATALLLHSRSIVSSQPRLITQYRLALVACIASIAIAGHYGNLIAHGGSSPFYVLALALGGEASGEQRDLPNGGAFRADGLFESSIGPILELHCNECHGAEKQEGGLRLDSREAALAGGESGKPAIVPGDAMASRLVRAVTLPRESDYSMPPSGKGRLEPQEVVSLINWINRGAPWHDATARLASRVARASASEIDGLRARGFHLSELSEAHPLLRVDAVPDQARLSELSSVAQQVTWLNLARYDFAAGESAALSTMPNLTRLELQGSNVEDHDIVHLTHLTSLIFLNLHDTRVSDSGLAHLQKLDSLESLFLWRTRTTSPGIQTLKAELPEANVDTGLATHHQSPEPER
jgi:uncharacterized membrane protein